MLFRSQTIIRREGWYYLLVLAFVITGSILRDVNLLMVMAGMMFFPFLFNLRAVFVGLRGLNVRRRLPAVVSVGDLLVVDVILRKQAARYRAGRSNSSMVTVADSIRNETSSQPGPKLPKLMLWRLQSGEETRLFYRCRLNRRGRYRLGPLKLSTSFPLGLVRRTVTAKSDETLTVLPRLGRLTHNWARLYQEVHLGSHASRSRHGILEGDFHSLRDWRPGDSRRRIHWRTTARRGVPVVRQFELHHEQDLALLLDLWQPQQPAAAAAETLERIISFAATVVTDICRRGSSSLYLGTTGRHLDVLGGPASSGLMYELLERLAVAMPDDQDRLPELVARTVETVPPGLTMVIVSPRPLVVGDLEKAAALWDSPARRAATGRIVTLDASGDALAEYFIADSSPLPALAGEIPSTARAPGVASKR